MADTYLVRRVYAQARWKDTESWLAAGEASADCCRDLLTDRNALSVFALPSENKESILTRVAIAMQAKCDHYGNFDCVVFDRAGIDAAGINAVAVEGDTPDKMVNALHLNCTEISAAKLAVLANYMKAGGTVMRIRKRDLVVATIKAFKEGYLDPERINPNLGLV